MRYYLISDDGDELVYDIVQERCLEKDRRVYKGFILKNHKILEEYTIQIKRIAGKYFVSKDGLSWSRLAKQHALSHLLNHGKVYKVYRGYRPSGQTGVEEGAFYTKMPGKVVKILVSEGQRINKGDTVVIIEAMKMENEIKSHYSGVINKIHVQEGQAVDQNVLLLELENDE